MFHKYDVCPLCHGLCSASIIMIIVYSHIRQRCSFYKISCYFYVHNGLCSFYLDACDIAIITTCCSQKTSIVINLFIDIHNEMHIKLFKYRNSYFVIHLGGFVPCVYCLQISCTITLVAILEDQWYTVGFYSLSFC